MHLTTVLTLTTLTTLAAALPRNDLDCFKRTHPCENYQKHRMCSQEYNTLITLCEASGCVPFQSAVAPICSNTCGDALQICNTFMEYEKCTPMWVREFNACKRTNCPLPKPNMTAEGECKTGLKCDDKEHPCNTYWKVEQVCGSDYLLGLQKCMLSGCKALDGEYRAINDEWKGVDVGSDPRSTCYGEESFI